MRSTSVSFFLALGLVFPSLLFISCKDEPEPIPAYLHMQPFQVDAGGDAGWHKVTDAWVYVNGEFLGAYTLPDTVPFLAEGDAEVLLFPGVKENGIVTTPNIYPFLVRDRQMVNMLPGEIVSVQPVTRYDNQAIMPWTIERGAFDSGSTLVLENRDSDPDTGFEIRADGAFSGKSLFLDVNEAHPLMSVSTESVVLPSTFEREVWLELHYYNDVPFTLWLSGSSPLTGEISLPFYQFNPSPEGGWNKIYFNLTQTLINLQFQENYRLLFQVSLPTDIGGGYAQPAGTVGIDNIRLVHF